MIEPPGPREIAVQWRPQLPGRADPRRIPDAIVEPAWGGARVVAALTVDSVALVSGGEDVAAPEELLRALIGAFRAEEAVVEGHLTTEALRGGEGARPPMPSVERPPILVPRLTRQVRDDPFVLGRDHTAAALAAEPTTLAALEHGERHAFVATDLLWLDGQSLLKVPLLERKRLLEAILEESYLVRVSVYVRASAILTLVAWGSLGFRNVVHKAANSRYRPGEESDDWAVARVPRGPEPMREPAAPR